jgi:hypothetical protein
MNIAICARRALPSASFWRRFTTKNGFTPRPATCRRVRSQSRNQQQQGSRFAAAHRMSFLRHREIYPSDGDASLTASVPAHRLDEFPAGYSSADCSPAVGYRTGGPDNQARNRPRAARRATLIRPERRQLRPRTHWCFHKPDQQCGSGPRAQYSDDPHASSKREGSRLGDYLSCRAQAARGQTRRK